MVIVQGKIMVEIELGQCRMQTLSSIIFKLKSSSETKHSETKNILILTNVLRLKKPKNEHLINSIVGIIDPSESHCFSNIYIRKQNYNMRNTFRKRISKRFRSHIGCLKSTMELLASVNLNEPLSLAKNYLAEMIETHNAIN